MYKKVFPRGISSLSTGFADVTDVYKSCQQKEKNCRARKNLKKDRVFSRHYIQRNYRAVNLLQQILASLNGSMFL